MNAVDADNDGASSATIAGGDTFVERVTSGGVETSVPGMLNFVFNTTPAMKTVVTGVATYDIDYGAHPRQGSQQSCMEVPATGNVVVTITGWRPQRPATGRRGRARGWTSGSRRSRSMSRTAR